MTVGGTPLRGGFRKESPIRRPVANDLEIITGIEKAEILHLPADPDQIKRMLKGQSP